METIEEAARKTGIPEKDIQMGIWSGTVDSELLTSGRFISDKGMEQLREIAQNGQ
jgi:hypothetical protein